MSNEWVETLRASAVTNNKSGPDIPGHVDITLGNGVQLVDLSDLMIVEITGDDAAAFLQGQFCNDLKQVSSTHAQITGYCTPKGRLLALPTIVGFDNGFRLLIPTEIAENFLKRLRMFVMRSAVTVTERDDWVCIGLIADESGDLGSAATHLRASPVSPMNVATTQARQVIRWHDDYSAIAQTDDSQAGRQRYITMASKDDQITLWNACNDAGKHSMATWRLGDISAGIPTVTTGVVESFVPQMLNLQLIDALSFTKGCYPGQEIVARMQYLGKLKRHMRLFKLSPADKRPDFVPVPGSALSIDGSADAGVVIDAIHDGGKDVLILAVTKVSANTSMFFFNESTLLPVDLPYSLPSLDETQADAS